MLTHEELKALGVEWVNPSADGRRPGYFRKVPRTRVEPTIRQAEHRLKFAQTAYNTFGTRGVTQTTDSREIPANAQIIANGLAGTGQPRRVISTREKLIRLILEK